MRTQVYRLALVAMATLIGTGTAWGQSIQRSGPLAQTASATRTTGNTESTKKVSAKEKRLTKSYAKKVKKFKRTTGGKELKETDWFVTGIRIGNRAEFRPIGSEQKAVQWSVQQALTKNKNRTWKILGRFANRSSAEQFVQQMQTKFEQQLVTEREVAVRNAELARQAALARQRSFQQHSSGSC